MSPSTQRFWLGTLFGIGLGMWATIAAVSHAQLVPFTAPLEDQLAGQQAENYLRLQRELERAEANLYRSPLLPCR